MTGLAYHWKPRSSTVGAYASCLYRAACDRMNADAPGEGWAPAPQDDTSAADHGTCCHFVLQDGTRSLFAPRNATDEEALEASEFFAGPDGITDQTGMHQAVMDAHQAYRTGDPRAYQPTAAQWASGAKRFGNDPARHRSMVDAVAALAAQQMPKAPDGKPWIAEGSWENDLFTGHTDFTSQCLTMGGDLKTTSRPPVHNKVKARHLAQIASYYLLTGIPLWWVLYVDSMKAQWACLCWVDFTKPDMQFYAEQIEGLGRLLGGPHLLDIAFPNLGDHCSDDWCPYRTECADRIKPLAGRFFDVRTHRSVTGVIGLKPTGIIA